MESYTQPLTDPKERLDYERTLEGIRKALARGDSATAELLEARYQKRVYARQYYAKKRENADFTAERQSYASEAARRRWAALKADPIAFEAWKSERARIRAEREQEAADAWLVQHREARRKALLAEKYADLV